MKRNSVLIPILVLVLAIGVVNTPIIKAQGSATFWSRGVGSDYMGVVADIGGAQCYVVDLGTCYTVSTTSPVDFSFLSPLAVDSTKQYVWIYTTSDTTPPVTTQSGTIPAEMLGNIFGYYETQYLVTFSSNGAGTTNPTGAVMLSEGANIITATPTSGHKFTSWESTGSIVIADSNSASTTATINGPGTIKATFVEQSTTTKYVIFPTAVGNGTITPSFNVIVEQGDTKTFVFNPAEGYKVASLYIDGEPMQVAASYTFTNVRADHRINVTFSVIPPEMKTVTVDSNPSGQGFLIIDGIQITTPSILEWAVGSNHTLEAISTVNGETGIRYAFSSWDDGGSQIHNYTVTNNSTSVKADFDTQYKVTIKTNFGTTNPLDGSWYPAGSKIIINAQAPSAVASESYVFGGWKGSIGGYTGGNNPSDEITVTGPITEETEWQHIYELVIVSPDNTAQGAGWYEVNQVVNAIVTKTTLTEGANTQHLFIGWGGDASGVNAKSDNIVMDGPKRALSLWQTQYRLEFKQSNIEGGIFGVNDAELLTVNDTKISFQNLPYVTKWINSGEVITYSYKDSVTSSLGQVLTISEINGPQSPLSVTAANSITAAYASTGFAFTSLNILIILLILILSALLIIYVRKQNKDK